MSTPRTADCRKFSPNIFNKSKCSHCFRQREEHSAAALECNRASRKVSKCGYLFVAPDWDFSNPLYRTKRWQRRWFVLYDDGELTYSVDEHPETVPQACIDMTKVLEVATAEDVTGHSNSIAITAPDRVTFVKGTCSEESKWWFNILVAFPKSKGRHKRNATFPGAQSNTTPSILQQTSSDPSAALTTQHRNRHNSYHKDTLSSTQSSGSVLIGADEKIIGQKNIDQWQHNTTTVLKKTTNVKSININNEDDDDDDDDHGDDNDEDDDVVDNDEDEDDGVETGEDEDDEIDVDNENENVIVVGQIKDTDSKLKINRGQDENNRNAGNEMNSQVSSSCLLIEDIRRDEKTIKDLANTITNLSQQQKNRWSTTAVNNAMNIQHHHRPHHLLSHVYSNHHLQYHNHTRDEIDFHRTLPTTTTSLKQQQQREREQSSIVNLRPNSLPLASNSSPAIVSAIVKKIPPVLVASSTSTPTTTITSISNQTAVTSLSPSTLCQPTPLAIPVSAPAPAPAPTLPSTSSSSLLSLPTIINSSVGSNTNQSHNCNNSSINNKSSPRLQLQLKHLQKKHQSNQDRQKQHWKQKQQQQEQQHQERGDPDGGCNLDDLSSNYLAKSSEMRVNTQGAQSATTTTTASTTQQSIGTMVIDSTGDDRNVGDNSGKIPNAKKGWLMKQDSRTGDWTKHWFTLNGAALFYFRDSVSEERGVLDGVLDVNSLTNVCEVNANKNYAFQLTTWDKRRLILASLSPNSRNSWIIILKHAAGLQINSSINNNVNSSNTSSSICNNDQLNSNVNTTSDELNNKNNASNDAKSEIEQDFMKAQRHLYKETKNNNSNNNNLEHKKIVNKTSPQVIISTNLTTRMIPLTAISPITPTTPKTTHFSSDEEYRTASEGGRRDSIDWGSPLSPSPPIPLSLLRAKERMRTRTGTMNCPHSHKRSRSSPPTSRRSTVDSVGSDELPLIQTVCEEFSIDRELQVRLNSAVKERDILRNEAKEREARMSELLTTLERTEQELTAIEEVRENLTTQLEDAKRNAEDVVDRLNESQRKIKDLEDRLTRGIDENEILYKRLRELESCSPSSLSNLNRNKLKRMDSLSDLTQISDIDPYCLQRDNLAEEYKELRTRFEKAVNEIRAMKRELKESQNQFDSLEISYGSLKQDLERKDVEDRSQLQMMAVRIQDLTLKYSSSERQVRTLKQKLAKSERRRSLSLKGKEQLTVSKELEIKVSELETKIDEMEKSSVEQLKSPVPKTSSRKSSRRRSLESSACADSLQFMVRINDLEKRFDSISSIASSISSTQSSSSNTVDSSNGGVKLSDHLIERLRCIESVLIASKDRLEHGLQQLQNLRSNRTRRSVSPMNDRKDSYKYVERCLAEVVKLIRDSCETCLLGGTSNLANNIHLNDASPVKMALTHLQSQLRNKLSDLLKQRRMLRERNELTKNKDLELLAERIAFESVCFGKLRDSMERAENPELFGERQTRAEVAETSHLMTTLKAKLSGKCTLKPSGSLDVLAGVLARRLMLSTCCKGSTMTKVAMEPVDQNILDDLLRQQNEINVIASRYKNNAMETLATGWAVEALSYISSNDLVQSAMQEAWRQAQQTVNTELVQSEISHIMMRNAQRFENSTIPAFGYTLTATERLSFEKFADAVHDVLRKEMDVAVTQLTHCYDEAMQKIKRGQWRAHLAQERKPSEGRQLLTEFADIIAHKALIDARIGVLSGENINRCHDDAEVVQSNNLGITALQRYENLFEELSSDLQITNPDDILFEADFEFLYKQHTAEFLNNRQVLSDISTFLSQLEDSLIALQCEAASTTSIPRTAISIESLQDVCNTCCELRKRADQLLQDVHRKLNTPCQLCLQLRDKLCSIQQQHENEILHIQQTHAKDMSVLLQQLDNQKNALKNLETEKNAINCDLHKSEELIEEHERELKAVNNQLQMKQEEFRMRDNEKFILSQRLEEHEDKLRLYKEENNTLTLKCARQDEEYMVLLQERDIIQSELSKEQERCRRLEKRLEMLELEHGKQLECLQDAYRDQLQSHCSDFANVADEESFRQRYQAEIEQLRTLCEKGLSAMESSHRRILGDIEEKHRNEIERLLIDKETALAEETQATLAALDAMRKAHQSEVQREVAHFKQEFLNQFQRGDHTYPDSTRAKEEELEELRQEILSFSEKYSIKCVENAALEEKLRSANQKLKHFQQMQQLELRNKQFRAHLAADDPSSATNFIQGLVTSKDETACLDSESFQVNNTHNVTPPMDKIISDVRVISTETTNINTLNNITGEVDNVGICKRNMEGNICLAYKNSDFFNQNLNLTKANQVDIKACDADDKDDHSDDGHEDILLRYSYEPCYKQINLFSFQNRTSLEGLKSSTFGKNLKIISGKSSSKLNFSIQPTSTSSAAALPSEDATELLPKQQPQIEETIYKMMEDNQINYENVLQQIIPETTKQKTSTAAMAMMAKRKQTNPVEEPKNFSANNFNINVNYKNLTNNHKRNFHFFYNKYLNDKNLNYNNHIKNNEILTATKAITECAKESITTTKMRGNVNIMENITTAADDDVDGVGVKCNEYKQLTNIVDGYQPLQLVTTINDNSICSLSSLSGRNDEHSLVEESENNSPTITPK